MADRLDLSKYDNFKRWLEQEEEQFDRSIRASEERALKNSNSKGGALTQIQVAKIMDEIEKLSNGRAKFEFALKNWPNFDREGAGILQGVAMKYKHASIRLREEDIQVEAKELFDLLTAFVTPAPVAPVVAAPRAVATPRAAPVPVPVDVAAPVHVAAPVPVPVDVAAPVPVPVHVAAPVPVPVDVAAPVHVAAPVPVPVDVAAPVHVAAPVPVPVDVAAPVSVATPAPAAVLAPASVSRDQLMLQGASFYRDWGMVTLPLKYDQGGKIPSRDGWRQASLETCLNLFDGLAYNIGIQTGDISNLFVIDLDPAKSDKEVSGVMLFKKMLQDTGNGWPVGLRVLSGNRNGERGIHLWFRMEPRLAAITNSSKIGIVGGKRAAVDIRTNGGYIVAPPSHHLESGVNYEFDPTSWENGQAQILPMPDFVFDWLSWLISTKEGKVKEKIAAPALQVLPAQQVVTVQQVAPLPVVVPVANKKGGREPLVAMSEDQLDHVSEDLLTEHERGCYDLQRQQNEAGFYLLRKRKGKVVNCRVCKGKHEGNQNAAVFMNEGGIWMHCYHDKTLCLESFRAPQKQVMDLEGDDMCWFDYCTTFRTNDNRLSDLGRVAAYLMDRQCWAIKEQKGRIKLRTDTQMKQEGNNFSYMKLVRVSLKIFLADHADSVAYKETVFRPYPPLGKVELPSTSFNIFTPFKTVPAAKVDVTPVRWFIKHLLYNDLKEHFDFFERIMALRLQRPDLLPAITAILVDPRGGSGKSLILQWLAEMIFGFILSGCGDMEDIAGTYNSCIENKLLFLVEETRAEWGKSKAAADKLKNIITARRLRFKEKFLQSWEGQNHTMFWLLSNDYWNPANLPEGGGRRVWMAMTKQDHNFSVRWFYWFARTYLTQDMADSYADYLMKLDLSDFLPSEIPTSEIKEQVAQDTKLPAIAFLEQFDWTQSTWNGVEFVKGPVKNKWTTEELQKECKMWIDEHYDGRRGCPPLRGEGSFGTIVGPYAGRLFKLGTERGDHKVYSPLEGKQAIPQVNEGKPWEEVKEQAKEEEEEDV